MKPKVAFVIKLLVTAALLLAIAWKVDLDAALRLFGRLPLWGVVLSMLLVLTQQWLGGARFSLVLRLFGRILRLGGAFRLTIKSIFFSQAFVSFLGADAFRIWHIRGAGMSLADAAAAVTFDRLNGFAVNHLVLVASLPWLLGRMTDALLRLGVTLIGAGGVVAFALVMLLGLLRDRPGAIARLGILSGDRRLTTLLFEISTVGRHFLGNGYAVVGISLLSLASTAINVAVFFVVLIGFGTPPGLAVACALAAPLVIEIAFVPVSIAGWGLREGAAGVIFGALGLEAPVAVAASLAFGLLGLVVSVLGGGLWLVDRRKLGIADMAPAAVCDVAALSMDAAKHET